MLGVSVVSTHAQPQRGSTSLIAVIILSLVAGMFISLVSRETRLSVNEHRQLLTKHTLKNQNISAVRMLNRSLKAGTITVDCRKRSLNFVSPQQGHGRGLLRPTTSGRQVFVWETCDPRFYPRKMRTVMFNRGSGIPNTRSCKRILSQVSIESCQSQHIYVRATGRHVGTRPDPHGDRQMLVHSAAKLADPSLTKPTSPNPPSGFGNPSFPGHGPGGFVGGRPPHGPGSPHGPQSDPPDDEANLVIRQLNHTSTYKNCLHISINGSRPQKVACNKDANALGHYLKIKNLNPRCNLMKVYFTVHKPKPSNLAACERGIRANPNFICDYGENDQPPSPPTWTLSSSQHKDSFRFQQIKTGNSTKTLIQFEDAIQEKGQLSDRDFRDFVFDVATDAPLQLAGMKSGCDRG